MQFAILTSIGLLSFAITTGLVPASLFIGLKYNLTDKADHRKKNKKDLVRIGGCSIFLGFFISLLFANLILGRDLLQFSNEIKTFFIGSFLLFLIGLFDDIFNISPLKRLVFQVGIASYLWYSGLFINTLDFSWLGLSMEPIFIPKLFSLIITILWISGIVNAINWIDGLDGLAVGYAGITAIGFLIINLSYNNFTNSCLSSALIGSCLAFLRFNKRPARILMGDSGSYFLGICLASIGIFSGSQEYILEAKAIDIFDLSLPFMILIYPILDMTIVIMQRLFNRLSPFYPDRRHFHHKLLNIGFSHDEVIYTIYLMSSIVLSIVCFLRFENVYLLIPIFIFLFLLFKNKYYLKLLKKK